MSQHIHKLEWRRERIENTDDWRDAYRCAGCHEEFVPVSKLGTRDKLLREAIQCTKDGSWIMWADLVAWAKRVEELLK